MILAESSDHTPRSLIPLLRTVLPVCPAPHTTLFRPWNGSAASLPRGVGVHRHANLNPPSLILVPQRHAMLPARAVSCHRIRQFQPSPVCVSGRQSRRTPRRSVQLSCVRDSTTDKNPGPTRSQILTFNTSRITCSRSWALQRCAPIQAWHHPRFSRNRDC